MGYTVIHTEKFHLEIQPFSKNLSNLIEKLNQKITRDISERFSITFASQFLFQP